MTPKTARLAVILAAAVIVSMTAEVTAAGRPTTGYSAEVERHQIDAFVSHFLTAFENLDLPSFMACFAHDATVFFPMPEPPERVTGKVAIQQRFQQVFQQIRKDAPSGPPYHHLTPGNTLVQMVGPAEAVVTFELKNNERIARRTLVLKSTHGQWQIVHLHASNIPLTAVRVTGK